MYSLNYITKTGNRLLMRDGLIIRTFYYGFTTGVSTKDPTDMIILSENTGTDKYLYVKYSDFGNILVDGVVVNSGPYSSVSDLINRLDQILDNYTTIPIIGGRIYQRGLISGLSPSLFDYDEYWHRLAGTYNYDPPVDGEMVQLEDFYNLKPSLNLSNTFGHYRRFTGQTGGYFNEPTLNYRDVNHLPTTKNLAFPNDYLIDHLTGLGYIIVNQWTDTFQNILNNINSLVFNGFSDFRMVNLYEFMMVNDSRRTQNANQMPPFSTHSGGFTCSYDINGNPLAQFTNGNCSISGINPVSVRRAMICRTHF